jgi:uncharacterized DUF497 family protein
MDAEWDEKKRLANLTKHGIDFNRAALIFGGPIVEYPQQARDYGEERIAAIGRTEDLFLYVIYTWRDNRRRIISARRAGHDERERYYESLV